MSRNRHRGRAHGRILEVTEETLGSVLAADAAAGATVLYVDDAADFEDDGTGGWLEINDQVVAYTDVDDDAGTITIKAGLTAAAEDGDPVHVWSKLYDEAATLKTALVQVDGEDDNTDPVVATLSDAVQDLPEGLRGEAGENCTLHQVSADEWEVTAVGGRPSSTKGASAIRFCDTDTFTVTAAGAQSFQLSHQPIDGSVHMIWNGLDQPRSESTVNGTVVTIPDPNGLIQVGDVIDFKYAYRVGLSSPGVGFGAAWSYLQVASTDNTDRSAVDFNDSSWAQGTAPFSSRDGLDPLWPTYWANRKTNWNAVTRLWLRKSMPRSSSGYTINVRIDNSVLLYWNGSLLTSASDPNFTTTTATITPAMMADSNVLALRAEDTGAPSYIDVEVVTGS